MAPLVTVRDGSFFGNNALGMAQERSRDHPRYFRWQRLDEGQPAQVYTDVCLEEAVKGSVALIVESPAISPHVYDWVDANRSRFRAVLSHLKGFGAWYPLGGSWIKDWGLFEKTRHCSLLISNKRATEGHSLRHEAAELDLDVFGPPYTGWVEKKVALRGYRFSVVIENCRANYYFSEKLVDCLSQGTIPLYWGCDVSNFFDMRGIVRFESLHELGGILERLRGWRGEQFYRDRLTAVRENLERARYYACAENWIWETYDILRPD